MASSEVYLYLIDSSGEHVKGYVQAKDYEEQIELENWGWGSSLGEIPSGGRLEDIQAQSKQFKFKKFTDPASTSLFRILNSGEKCQRAVVTMAQRTEKNLMLRVSMKQVKFQNCKLSLQADDTKVGMSENWTINFEEIELLYKGVADRVDVRGAVNNSTIRAAHSFKMLVPKGAEFLAKADPPAGNPSDMGGDEQKLFKAFQEFMKKSGN